MHSKKNKLQAAIINKYLEVQTGRELENDTVVGMTTFVNDTVAMWSIKNRMLITRFEIIT